MTLHSSRPSGRLETSSASHVRQEPTELSLRLPPRPTPRDAAQVPVPLEECVVAFQKKKSPELLEQITHKALPTIRFIADKLAERLPVEAPSSDELTSAGFDGLLSAIDKFDPARGVKFLTYLAPRVRGAMLDFLRESDWAPRLVRHRQGTLKLACDSFFKKHGHSPNEGELRAHLGVSEEEFSKLREDGRDLGKVRSMFAGVSGKAEDPESDLTLLGMLVDPSTEAPDARLQQEELLAEILSGRSVVERNLFELYFFEGIGMKRIGELFDLSESRVSQLITLTLQIVRERYSDLIRAQKWDEQSQEPAQESGESAPVPALPGVCNVHGNSKDRMSFIWDKSPVDELLELSSDPAPLPEAETPVAESPTPQKPGEGGRLNYRWTQ